MNRFFKNKKNYTLASVTLLCLMFFQTWSIQLNANTISNEATPFTVEVTTTHILCAEVCDGSALAVVTGGTPPFKYLWQNGDTRQHLDWEPAGLYEVTVTDADGHTATASGSINEPPPIAIDLDINYQGGSCDVGLTEVTATATGGTPGFTYEWSNGAWEASVCLAPGNYWITVTDANGCKKGIDNFAVANCGLQVDVDIDYGQCGSNSATVTANVTGATAPISYNLQPGNIRMQTVTGLAPGRYTFFVRDALGCKGEQDFEIFPNPGLNVSIVATNARCGQANGSATATATDGNGMYSYTWSNGATGTTITNLAPGTYTVTATDSDGCTGTASVTIIDEGNLDVSITQTNARCGQANGSATANATGGNGSYTYTWSNGATGATITGLTPGTYTVTAMDSDGCMGSESITIVDEGNLDVTIIGINAKCDQFNGSATANTSGGSGNYSYNWSNGETTRTITDLPPGDYSVIVTDSLGCMGSDTITITNDSTLDVTITKTDAKCGQLNGTATANTSGGSGTYSYNWSNGEMTRTIIDFSPGDYSVIVTDSLSCMGFDTITIENDLDSVDVTILPHQDTVCLGDVLEITATTTYSGTNSLTYDWSPDNLIVSGDNTPTVIVSTDTPGTFQVCVELSVDSTNCTGNTCTEYTVIEKKVINPDTISYSQCDSLTIDFVGIDAQWFFDIDDLSIMSTGSNPSYTFPDTGIYKVLIVPNCPCPDTICKVVTVEPLSVDFDCDLTECIDTCKLTVTDISVVPGTITSWEWTIKDDNNQTIGTATDSSPMFDILKSGTYIITLRIEFGDSCVQEITKLKSMTCPAEPEDLSISVCLGDTTKFILPGGPNIIFTGSQDSMFTIDTLGNGCFIGWTPGTFEYCVIVTNNNCIDTIKVIGICFSNPTVEIEGDTIVCDSSIVILDAVSADSNDYKWALDTSFVPIIGTNDTLLVQPGRPTTYYVMVTDNNGCTAIDEHTIGNYQVDISIMGDPIICHGDSTILTLQNGNAGDTLDIIWTPLDIILSGQGTNTVTVKPLNNSVIFVETTNQFGCMATDSFQIQVNDPSAELEITTDSLFIYKTGTSHLSATEGFTTYSWVDGSTLDMDDIPDPTATPEITTVYQLTVTDSIGCEATEEITITVQASPCDRTQLFLPNAFTPNDDGLNDRLLVKSEIIDEFRIQVYDRWGKLVYESDNKDEGWDGTWLNQGEEASADVYGYCMTIVCICGEEYVESGNITILR